MIADCGEVIRLKPDYADAYLERGCVYLRLKQYEQAIADFTGAIAARAPDRDHACAYRYRAIAYRLVGQRDRARADFRTAERIKLRAY